MNFCVFVVESFLVFPCHAIFNFACTFTSIEFTHFFDSNLLIELKGICFT